jgi:CheY-like chemotaxis protein
MHRSDVAGTIDTRLGAAARSLLEYEGMTVLGAASNGADALRLAADLRPDVLLIDMHLGRESGLELGEAPRQFGQLRAAGDTDPTRPRAGGWAG